LVALQERISQRLNARADVMTRGSLHPRARALIESSAVRVSKRVRDLKLRLEDIVEALDGIEQTLAGVDFEMFARSWSTQRAIERGLEIVSEASQRIGPSGSSDAERWRLI
jgi:hypothetical protein